MRLLERCWYLNHPLARLLVPLSWLFGILVMARRYTYRAGWRRVEHPGVPVIVVGNLTVGGSGKTPLVSALVALLRQLGYRPGVVCRGYGGGASHWPQQVRADSDPYAVGDEAVLLAGRCGCPVAADPERPRGARALAEVEGCDVVISDDGLQHYALARDVEIVVVDGQRRFGNGLLLPAGPLREPLTRLDEVDMVVANGIARRVEHTMRLQPGPVRPVAGGTGVRPLSHWRGATVHAVAGIGNPERFFTLLRDAGLKVIEHPFPDHHPYRAEDFLFDDGLPVLMTEKDAVKWRRFAGENHWYVPVEAELDPLFRQRLLSLLQRRTHG